MSRRLTIGHGNVHNRLGPARRLARADCDSIGLNEAQRLIADLRLLNGYRLLDSEGTADPRSRETPMLVSRKVRNLGQLQLRIADASTPERVAPERWATVAMYEHPTIGPVSHTNLHLHWIGPAHDRPNADRVQKTHDAAVRVRRLLDWQQREGFARVVTGDVNIPEDRRSPQWLTAWEAFAQAGLEARSIGKLDAIAWDPAELRLLDLDVIGKRQSATDHPMLIAQLGAA